jgi:predicted nucleic acid-binding protein
VLAEFDRFARLVPLADRAPYVCKDLDDQKFIDLACAYFCALVSKDKAVLTMRNRLARVGVSVVSRFAV